MLKWLKLHKRKIYAFLACLAVFTLFSIPCFAYDASVEDVIISNNGTYNQAQYISYSCYAYDYRYGVNNSDIAPTATIPINGIAKDTADAYGHFYSATPLIDVTQNLYVDFAKCQNYFDVSSYLDNGTTLGLRLTTDFTPFYLIWNDDNIDTPFDTYRPFNVIVRSGVNNDIFVENSVVLEVSPLGKTDTIKIKFVDTDTIDISYDDILDYIPPEWNLSINNDYALYVHDMYIVTDISNGVDVLNLSSFGVDHIFDYGKNGTRHTLCDGIERYYDLDKKFLAFDVEVIDGYVYVNGINTGILSYYPPVVDVIDGYVYVNGVKTDIEVGSLDDVDWLHVTLDWLSNAVDGFLKIEFVPYVTLGTLLIIIVSFSVVMWWLKVFGGG